MEELLFHKEYEEFYNMANRSSVFRQYCEDAFGRDFSQDGFSDIRQINRIFDYIPQVDNLHILDVGCGNGKMIKYIQSKTNAHIYGFDYSANAIHEAKIDSERADFQVGCMGEVEYSAETFDMVISMDSIYFAEDMGLFVAQIFRWLKPGGIFFVGYQEGDVMEKTENCETTFLAQAFRKGKIRYQVLDITEETYAMLKRKRESAMKYKRAFESEGMEKWYAMLVGQTDCVKGSLEGYKQGNARYLYIAKK